MSSCRLNGPPVRRKSCSPRRCAPDALSNPVFQATAMLEWWAKELGVGVDVPDLLRLDGSKRAMYRNFS